MDQAKELLEMPREFVKDGRQFITRCSKRMPHHTLHTLHTFHAVTTYTHPPPPLHAHAHRSGVAEGLGLVVRIGLLVLMGCV